MKTKATALVLVIFYNFACNKCGKEKLPIPKPGKLEIIDYFNLKINQYQIINKPLNRSDDTLLIRIRIEQLLAKLYSSNSTNLMACSIKSPTFANSENAKFDVFTVSNFNDTIKQGVNINHLIGQWGIIFNNTIPLNSRKHELTIPQDFVLMQNPQSDSIKLRIKLTVNSNTIRETETDWIFFK